MKIEGTLATATVLESDAQARTVMFKLSNRETQEHSRVPWLGDLCSCPTPRLYIQPPHCLDMGVPGKATWGQTACLEMGSPRPLFWMSFFGESDVQTGLRQNTWDAHVEAR